MKFCDYCQPFYSSTKLTSGIKGRVSQPAIAEFFMTIAFGDTATIELAFSDDLFRKWFKGEREPKAELWIKAVNAFDETRFSRAVSSGLNENVLADLIHRFGINLRVDEIPDKYAFSAALTRQFKFIADGNGEAGDAIEQIYREYLDVSDFPAYIRNAQSKYAKMKTLLYSSEERSFDEFFVCNTISTAPIRYGRGPSSVLIENVTLSKLGEKSLYSILVGMGGIGKSMMMRHLFLDSIKQYSQTGKLPILVILREFGIENNDLFNIIVDSVHRFDISFSAAHAHKLLSEGKCQILLDGLDEIKASDMDSFQRQLDALIDRYPQNQYVMSSRRFSAFVELARFTTLWMRPFSNAQALELIDKLEYCPEEPKLKQQFREQLAKEYFKSHAEFVTNPLLLTLMLMNYRRFSDVPEKKYLFYEQAYQTLLQRHDSDKLAYKRVFRSVTDPSDFTWVFREFCAKSFRKGDYEFDRKKFDDYFGKLKSLSRMDSSLMKADNFLFDICHSACLMYEEGQSYHFLHRSFQEYFFADYYSRQDDNTLRKLGNFIESADQILFDEGSAFDMLYDLSPDKVERFIIMPYLKAIYDIEQGNKYWTFLINGYSSWVYTLPETAAMEKYKEKYEMREWYPMFRNTAEVSSIILSLVLKILNVEPQIQFGAIGAELNYKELICETLYGECLKHGKDILLLMPSMRIPEQFLKDEEALKKSNLIDRLILDEEGKPVEFGHVFNYGFKQGIDEPEKYPSVKALWEKDSCPAHGIFNQVGAYYEELKRKYERVEELDDDDF